MKALFAKIAKFFKRDQTIVHNLHASIHIDPKGLENEIKAAVAHVVGDVEQTIAAAVKAEVAKALRRKRTSK